MVTRSQPPLASPPSAAAALNLGGRWLAGAADAFLRALPLLFLATLALLSHWLIRNAPLPEIDSGTPVVRQRPDYVMHGFVTTRFDESGNLRARLSGQQMRHLPDREVFEVDNPVHEQWDTAQRLTRSIARKGISNEDGSEIQLLSNVEVIRQGTPTEAGLVKSLRVTGDFLHLKAPTEQLVSHLPVVIERGKDRFEADAMVYDHLSQQMQLTGRVKGRFEAKAAAPSPQNKSPVAGASRVKRVN